MKGPGVSWSNAVAQLGSLSNGDLGTAWLISPDLAVTCAHCVVDRAGSSYSDENGCFLLRFRPPVGDVQATLLDNVDSVGDVAMLRLSQPLALDWPVLRVAFGFRLDIDEALPSWRSYGYPKGRRSGLALSGRIEMTTGAPLGPSLLQLSYSKGRPEELVWISGAPVLCAGRVIGVLKSAPAVWGDSTLDAVSLDHAARVIPELGHYRRSLEAEDIRVELRERLGEYLEVLARRLDGLPYAPALRRLSRAGKFEPPELTAVFVRPEYRTEIDDSLSRIGGSQPQLRRAGLRTALKTHRHVVLQGNPGSGKSSIVAELAVSTARRLIDGSSLPSWVPVPVVARDFAGLNEGSFEARLKTHLERRFRIGLPADVFRRPPYIKARWLVMIDGLDEVVDQDGRDGIIEDIKFQSGNSASVFRFLVTTRPLADVGKLRAPAFGRYMLLSFRREQIEDFASRWFAAMAPAEAEALTRRFLSWLERPGIAEVMTTPAMLTLAAVVYLAKDGSALPSYRIDLYQQYVMVMLAGDRDEGLRRSLVEKGYGDASATFIGNLVAMQDTLLKEMALRLQSDPDTDLVEVAVELINVSSWAEKVPADLLLPHRLEPLVEEILRGSGILEASSGEFTFVHNTMREFLAASRLVEDVTAGTQEAWMLLRRWGDARWREILLFGLALWSRREPHGPRNVGHYLDRISAVGPRGIHFAGSALAEGVQVENAIGDLIIDRLIARANRWNLCAEIFSEFASPDVTEVLRMLAHHPRLRAALFGYVRDGGNGCPKSLRVLFDFAEEIADEAELATLARRSSALWVRVGAMTGLLRRGATDLVLPLIREAGARVGAKYGIDIVLALHAAGLQEEILEIANTPEASKIVRLTALLYYKDGEDATSQEAFDDIVGCIKDWDPLTGDVLIKLATQGRLAAVLDSEALDASHGIRMCQSVMDAGHGELVMPYLSRNLANGAVDIRVEAAKLLVREMAPEDLLPVLRELAKSKEATPNTRVKLAELCGQLGYESHLVEIMSSNEWSVSDRCRAAIAFGNYFEKTPALDTLRRIVHDAKFDSSLDLRTLTDAAISIDSSGSVIDEALSWSAGRDEHGRAGITKLFELGRVHELEQQVRNTMIGKAQRERAAKSLRELGQGERLHQLAGDDSLDFDLRLLCIEILLELEWREEACEIAQRLIGGGLAPADQVKLAKWHDTLGFSEAAHAALRQIREDKATTPEVRFDALLMLWSSWKEPVSASSVKLLLTAKNSTELRVKVARWVTERTDPNVQNLYVEALETARSSAINTILEILRSRDLTDVLRRELLNFLLYRTEDASIPDDIIDRIAHSEEYEIDFNILSLLHRDQRQDKLVDVIVGWAGREMDPANRVLLAEKATEFGAASLVGDILSTRRLRESKDYDRLRVAQALASAGFMPKAIELLEGELAKPDLSLDMAMELVLELNKLGGCSNADATAKIIRLIEDSRSKPAFILNACCYIVDLGAGERVRDRLTSLANAMDQDSGLRLWACRALWLAGFSNDATPVLLGMCENADIGVSLPACALLLSVSPASVGLAILRTVLKGRGNFENEPLVDICSGVLGSDIEAGVHEEILTFISYCDFSSRDLYELTDKLQESGVKDLAIKLTRQLARSDRDALIEKWALDPEQNDSLASAG